MSSLPLQWRHKMLAASQCVTNATWPTYGQVIASREAGGLADVEISHQELRRLPLLQRRHGDPVHGKQRIPVHLLQWRLPVAENEEGRMSGERNLADEVRQVRRNLEKSPAYAPCGSKERPHVVHPQDPDICMNCLAERPL